MGFIESNPSSTIREHNKFWWGGNLFFLTLCLIFCLILQVWGPILLWLIIPFVGYNWYMVEDRLQYLKVSKVLYTKTPVPTFWESLTYKGDM